MIVSGVESAGVNGGLVVFVLVLSQEEAREELMKPEKKVWTELKHEQRHAAERGRNH